jgi:trehalose 6-phosphate phosphatase
MMPQDLADLARRAAAGHWLLAFDFDGTLVPIADHPDAVAFSQQVYRDLEELARRAPVAIISGRCRADLAARCPPGPLLLGNHGSEGLPDLSWIDARAREAAALWLPGLRRRFTGGGCWVEDKGLSLSLHWRAARDPARAEAVALRLTADLWPPPRLVGGHLVLNLLHPDLPDKHAALQHLLQHHPAVLFMGDDWNDASALGSSDPRIHGVQVGDLPLGAPWRLEDQAEVGRFLALLLHKVHLYA